jgi:hypothetical protein
MRKIPDLILDDHQPRPRRWRYSSALTIVLGLLLSPVVYEVGLLSAARWRGMSGTVPEVHTPVIDALGKVVASVRDEVQTTADPVLRDFSWKPSVVIPCAVVSTGIASLLLRKW